MKRGKINNTGIYIARIGFDVDTATENDLLLSPNSIVQRISESGLVASGAYIRFAPPGVNGYAGFYVTTINFVKTYVAPPQVIVNLKFVKAGLNYSFRPLVVVFGSSPTNGTRVEPSMFFTVSTTQLKVYTIYNNTQVPQVSYSVMETVIP